MKNTACEGNPLTQSFARREFFYVGLLGGLGLTLPQFLRMKAEGAQKHYETKTGVARSVINISLPGGMAHQESFDPKPYSPSEYRGPFGSINTAVKGVRFGENLPALAKIADKLPVSGTSRSNPTLCRH